MKEKPSPPSAIVIIGTWCIGRGLWWRTIHGRRRRI